ncbi:MAG: thioredoxin-disulfide reductase [Candidatus Eremiobacteraeota bacterium]|nr:thioredoxin-disulfide reductase [Candidatus Eremiobacteraeota bacterium]MBV8365087.1 thioredoxin-disulfide reductase [Candidatus Eremiobacteraeota bacterium]
MHPRKVIIIGSGPAGLTAAIYAARANLAPLVFAGGLYGGQLMLTSDVENYPGFPEGILGPELMEKFRAQAERFGAVIHNEDVTRVDFSSSPYRVWVDDEEHRGSVVVVATGASAQWLGLPNETRLRGRGVSSCATCDGAFFRDKDITVVGGGDTALEDGLFLTRFGRSVTVVHRRDSLRASKIMQQRAFAHPKMSFVWNTVVDDILGERGVTGVVLRDVQTGATATRPTDAVFVAIGHVPNTEIFAGQLQLDQRGYIISTDGVHTNVPGVFVAGDVQDTRYRQAVTAAGLGCRAAMEAEKYLESIESHAHIAAPAAG